MKQKMSKAEKKALKAYPVNIIGYSTECRVGATPQPQDWNEVRRKCYQEGYEQAEKDVLKTAIGVIKNYCDVHLLYEGARVKLVQFFTKEMKEKL